METTLDFFASNILDSIICTMARQCNARIYQHAYCHQNAL